MRLTSCLKLIRLQDLLNKAHRSIDNFFGRTDAINLFGTITSMSDNIQDPVQSIVSLTSSLGGQLVKCFTTL